jgi:hypothetical protein
LSDTRARVLNRATLEALPIAERIDALVDFLRTIASKEPAIWGDAMDAGAPRPDPKRMLELLHPLVLRDLQFPLYGAYDTRFCTGISELARHIAQELEPVPAPPTPMGDPYEGGSWSWGPLDQEFGQHRNRKAVFLLSAPRTGSTLLRVMLSRHPKLFAPPELYLLPFRSMSKRSQLLKSLDYGWMRRGLLSALVELEGLTPREAEHRVTAMEARDLPVAEVYALLQELAADRVLVDKTPAYAAHPDWLRRAESLFEGARYIHLVRHPNSAIESFVRTRLHRLLGRHWLTWDENAWRHGEMVWTAANLHISNFLKQVDPRRHTIVLYEDLVANPSASLTRICEFLEVPFVPAMLSPYDGDSAQPILDYLGHGPALGDMNFLQHSGIDSSLGARWATVRLPQRLGDITLGLAETFGYRVDSPPAFHPGPSAA